MVPCPTAARTPGVMRTVSYLGPAALCPGAIQDCYERLKTANFSLDMASDVLWFNPYTLSVSVSVADAGAGGMHFPLGTCPRNQSSSRVGSFCLNYHYKTASSNFARPRTWELKYHKAIPCRFLGKLSIVAGEA